MPVVVEYIGTVPWVAPEQYPEVILALWEARLKSANNMIYERLMSKIPNAEAFVKYLATPSSDQYELFVNPNYPRADFIKLKQRIKLAGAYPYWKAGIDKAFTIPEGETESYFMKQVTAKKEKMRHAVITLANVGTRSGIFELDGKKIFWGPGVKAVLLFTNDRRVLNYIDPDLDNLTAGPYQVIDPAVSNTSRPELIAILTQGVALAQWGYIGDRRDLIQTVVAAVNDILAKAISGRLASDIDATNTYIRLEYDSNTNTLSVHAHAETVTG